MRKFGLHAKWARSCCCCCFSAELVSLCLDEVESGLGFERMSLLAFWQLAMLLLAGPLKPGAAKFSEKFGCAGPAAELGAASIDLLMQFLNELGMGLRRPLRTSCAAISRISRELWLLKKAV